MILFKLSYVRRCT